MKKTDQEILNNLRSLWDIVEIKDSWQPIQKRIIAKILENKSKYEFVSDILKDKYKVVIPWQIISCIHWLEASGDFDKNLHNGQRWNKRTTIIPKGRGPFASWEMAAIDAMKYKSKNFPKEWSIENTLDFLEKYNGLGYRKYHKDVNTPYLWSGTNHYSKGKYVADGEWSSSAVSKQLGAVLILKGLFYNGRI